MMHKMKLNSQPFGAIAAGEKTVELRLNDEKRRLVKAGDFIEFSKTDDPAEKIITEVVSVRAFSSFAELFSAIPYSKCGFPENSQNDVMDAYYPPEKQAEYGALAIEIRLVKSDESEEKA